MKYIKNLFILLVILNCVNVQSMTVAHLVNGQPELIISNQQLQDSLNAIVARNNYNVTNIEVTDLFVEQTEGEYWLIYKFTCTYDNDGNVSFGSCAIPLEEVGANLNCTTDGGERKVSCKGKNCRGCIAKKDGCTDCDPPPVVPPATPLASECTSESSTGGNGANWVAIGVALINAIALWLVH